MEFAVTVTGTQYDAKWTEENNDSQWDEVWESATNITEEGWYCEMKIPYAALRFPNEEIQQWNFQIIRIEGKAGQRTSLFPVDPEGPSFLAQAGQLNGIKNIKPPVRLSIYPYLSTYLLHSKDNNRDPVQSVAASYNAGLDIKYGINDAFTLQSTLIPDFGQVRSDDQVLNLSPFEVQFNENRSFFTEGTEIFSKADLFYSRRIGSRPVGHWNVYNNLHDGETINNNPQNAQLINATKLSGRTNKGTGIGVFNAVEGASFATIYSELTGESRKEITQPITNYNVTVIDQNLPNNSSLSFINTNVFRAGPNFSKANVIGTNFNFKNKNQNYGISGTSSYSSIFNPQSIEDGYKSRIDLGKISGNFTFRGGIDAVSPNYNINDLGFNYQTNYKAFGLNARYSFFKPWKAFNRANFWANYNYQLTFDTNQFVSRHLNLGFWTQTKSQWNGNMWFNIRPEWNDIFEARTPGRILKTPGFINTGFWTSSDRRKKFYMSAFGFASNTFEKGRYFYELGAGPNWVVNSKLLIQADISYNQAIHRVGWVNNLDSDIILGQRNRSTIENEFTIDYNISKNLSLSGRLRHYWSTVYYLDFMKLEQDGSLSPSEYNEHHDANFNIINIDLNFRWRFAPGSDLFIVWKSNVFGAHFDDDINYRDLNYQSGINEILENPQTNSISLRIVYFLDYARSKAAWENK